MVDFGTIVTSMVTPFNEELRIDAERTAALLDHLIGNGTETVVLGDMAGESELLSREERFQLLKDVRNKAQGRLKVIVHLQAAGTSESESDIMAIGNEGLADGLLLTVPGHLGLTQEELIRYIEHLTLLARVPLFLHHNPAMGSVSLDPETIIRLSRTPHIVGVKHCGNDLAQITRILTQASPGFHVYTGDDRYLLPLLAIGGRGVFSAASLAVGRKMRDLVFYFKRGRWDCASEMHKELSTFFEYVNENPDALFMKQVIETKGLDVGGVRGLVADLKRDRDLLVKLVIANSI